MGSFFPLSLSGSGFAEGEEAPSPELTLGSRDAFSPVQKLEILNFLPILQVPFGFLCGSIREIRQVIGLRFLLLPPCSFRHPISSLVRKVILHRLKRAPPGKPKIESRPSQTLVLLRTA